MKNSIDFLLVKVYNKYNNKGGYTMKKVKELKVEEKNNIINKLWHFYKKYSYTKNYIIGCEKNNKIYYLSCEEALLNNFIDRFELTDIKNGYSLRLNITKKLKDYIVKNGTYFMSSEEFDKYVNDISDKNEGFAFEKAIAEHFTSEKWSRDSKNFKEAGDIMINNISYQVKFKRPTLTSTITMALAE